MYELIQAGEKSWYIKSPANVGVYRMNDTEVCLIDSGSDKDAARKILKALTERGWRVNCIINTHSNADHTGGNRFIQSKTGCRVMSTDVESAVARHPWLESSLIYGGFPYAKLRNKFLMAQPTEKTCQLSENLPDGLTVIKLPGHFLDMIGLMTDDGVCFAADALFSRETIEKYHVIFIYDVAKFIETLDMLGTLEARLFIPSHCDASPDIKELIALNRAKVLEIESLLLELCREPATFEKILKELFDRYSLTMDDGQYILVGSTVKSYLSYLYDRGKVRIEFIGNEMLWGAAS